VSGFRLLDLVVDWAQAVSWENAAMENRYTGVFERVGDWWTAYVEELPGCNVQERTLEEARVSLGEAIQGIVQANREVVRVAFALFLVSSLASAGPGQEGEQASRPSTAAVDHATVTVPEEVAWGPASPRLPPGAMFALIDGDPSKPGGAYTFRAKLPDGYSVPPHWHPMDENVTVIQGTFRLGMGRVFDPEKLRDLPAGSFVRLPKGEPHFNAIEGETIIQLHGIGPYDIHYINPSDDPSQRPGAK
jgi:predicted RNase H-like HicB family nuclease